MTTEQTEITNETINGYIEAVGRRKTATAIIRMYDAKETTFTVNGKNGLDSYFATDELIKTVQEPFSKGKIDRPFKFSIVVRGSGVSAQAEAIRHGIARALVDLDPNLRPTLKKLGYLKRDPRSKERRKFGLKKARKSPQWSKR